MDPKRVVKKGICVEDSRRRRESNMTSIRKDKKEEGLAKRRNVAALSYDEPGLATVGSGENVVECAAVDIKELVKMLHSCQPAERLEGIRKFRRLLSTERNPPVQICIESGALPVIVDFLTFFDFPQLQFEAAWALTNIASTSFTSVVVAHGAVPSLVSLLSSPSAEVREQSAWCLGNISGDSAELRDIVLSKGALSPLLANLREPANLSLLQNCTWSLSNMCRGKPLPALSTIGPAYSMLASLIQMNVDPDTTADATWALSYLSDGDDERISAVVDLKIVPALVQMLAPGSKPQSIIPALRTLGNIVSGTTSFAGSFPEYLILLICRNRVAHAGGGGWWSAQCVCPSTFIFKEEHP